MSTEAPHADKIKSVLAAAQAVAATPAEDAADNVFTSAVQAAMARGLDAGEAASVAYAMAQTSRTTRSIGDLVAAGMRAVSGTAAEAATTETVSDAVTISRPARQITRADVLHAIHALEETATMAAVVERIGGDVAPIEEMMRTVVAQGFVRLEGERYHLSDSGKRFIEYAALAFR